MNVLLISALFLNLWGVEEHSGSLQHPVLDFSNVPMPDTNLAYDVLHYDLSLNIDIPAETLSAEAAITLDMLAAADSIALHFVGLEVSAINEGASPRTFERVDSFLVVSLGRTASVGEEITLTISYHGQPTRASGGFGKGMYINPGEDDVTYTCNAPWGAKYWFPCQDNPADKAFMDMSVTVPEGCEVISNGKLEFAARTGPEWTFHWQETHPIATYLVALAASANYALTTDTVMVDATPVPVYHWVLKADSAEITPKLMVVAEVMEHFSELFYPYPFADEKYAHVATPVPGAMENQTCTHINTGINWGDWDIIVAHEFSHSWWGDATTCGNLKHMWLNEGFATYCEALWIEHRDGPAAYQDYYETDIAQGYLKSFTAHSHPILDFPWSLIYSALTYEKGAAVLHMLRRIVGDDDFFTILRTYGLRYQDSTALSEDFETVVDEVTGSDFSWFFNQWLRQPGHPTYQYSWSAQTSGDSMEVIINVNQIQEWPPEVPIFRMPVEFGLVEGVDTFFASFTDSLEEQTFQVIRLSAPSEVLFDPYGNLLCKVEYLGVKEEPSSELAGFSCNSICHGYLEYSFNPQTASKLSIVLYDASGRRVECWSDIKESGQLDLRHLSGGVYFVKIMSSLPIIHKVILIK